MPIPPETPPPTTPPPGDPAQGGASDDKPPAWASALFAPVMERLGRLEAVQTDSIKRIGKLNGKVKEAAGTAAKPTEPGGEGVEGQPAAGPKGVTSEDLAAAIKLGTVLAALPQQARDKLQGAVDAGDISFTDALERAIFLQENLPANGGATTTQGAPKDVTPDGKPASGARGGSPEIRTLKEYLTAKSKDPDGTFKRVMAGEINVAKLR